MFLGECCKAAHRGRGRVSITNECDASARVVPFPFSKDIFQSAGNVLPGRALPYRGNVSIPKPLWPAVGSRTIEDNIGTIDPFLALRIPDEQPERLQRALGFQLFGTIAADQYGERCVRGAGFREVVRIRPAERDRLHETRGL